MEFMELVLTMWLAVVAVWAVYQIVITGLCSIWITIACRETKYQAVKCGYEVDKLMKSFIQL